jgi:hypothetical protein
MARKGNDGVGVDAAVDQVLDAAAAEVVHQVAGEPDRGARPLPELPEVADGLAVAVEDVRAIERSVCTFWDCLSRRSGIEC